ncbi:MAG: phage tail fiber protein [Cetobacterium sp.]|uniref:phage tail fiber domain-containing protein n=1 Tax=Cetobacterium sp. TaxID=2071632 RepID=UPI003EE6A0DC
MTSRSLAPNTIKVYQLTGQTDFTIPFEYLARKFVVLTLLGVDRKVLTLNVDYRFVSKTVVSLTNPTTAGYDKLEVRRETSATERLVDFHDGSILRAYDLNLSQVQTLHVAEEARDLTADTIGVNDDGDLDARGRKIVNLGAGRRGTTDAANMLQLDEYDKSTLQNRDAAEAAKFAAEAARDAAKASQDAARASADAAYGNADYAKQLAAQALASQQAAATSEGNAKASEVAAKASEDAAKVSEGNALTQAQRAQSEADRAKTEADKLQNYNEFAATLESVEGKQPNFKEGIGIGLANDHGYMSLYSHTSGEDGSSRKGYVGLASSNTRDVTVGSDSGAVQLDSQGTVVRVHNGEISSTAQGLTLNSTVGENVSMVDMKHHDGSHRLYADNSQVIIQRLNPDGGWRRDVLRIVPHPNDGGRGLINAERSTVRGKCWGSTWQDSLTYWNSGFYSEAEYNAGSAVSAATLSVPARPNVGWPTNIGFGTLMDGRAGMLLPHVYAHCMDNAEFRGWEFQVDGRIRAFNQSANFGLSAFLGDFAPRNAPTGASGVQGTTQMRYGVLWYNGSDWNWHSYTEAFPIATLVVMMTQYNPQRFDNTWNPKVGSFNSAGFNFAGGGQERDFYYLAIGY